jgi:hypothetical protein
VKLWFAKVRRGDKVGLIPTDEKARAILYRMGDGECAEVELIRPRSVPWHRLYFGICRQIGMNQDPPRDESSIDHELRILAGHYDVIRVGRRPMPWWFGVLARTLEKQGRLGAWLVKRLRTKLGHTHEVYVPKRIAFAKLSADEWAELWPSLEMAIREHFGEEYIREQAA